MNNFKIARDGFLCVIRSNTVKEKGINRFFRKHQDYLLSISDLDINNFLVAAIKSRNYQNLKLLLERLPKMERYQEFVEQLLLDALTQGNEEIVELLLEQNAYFGSYFQVANGQFNPLRPRQAGLMYLAAKVGLTRVLRYFLEQGVDINEKDPLNNNNTGIHGSVADAEVTRFLLSKGANVNAFNRNQETALHYAVNQKNLESVKLLIDHGALVNCSTEKGLTPLHYAVRNNCIDIVKFLLEQGANVNSRDVDASTPLHYAIRNKCIDIVKFLLEQGANVNSRDVDASTPLHIAIKNNCIDIVKFLLKRGANVQLRDVEASTPLHMAISSGSYGMVKLLILYYKCDLEKKDNNGNGSLHLAAALKNTEILQFLLLMGAKVNVKNAEGQTPLFIAAKRGTQASVVLLLNRSAVISDSLVEQEKNLQRQIAEIARNSNVDVLQRILDLHPDVKFDTIKGSDIPFEIQTVRELNCAVLLMKRGANVDQVFKNNFSYASALQFAIVDGNIEVAEILLELGVDINKRSNYFNLSESETPLYYALSRAQSREQMITWCLENGANVNILPEPWDPSRYNVHEGPLANPYPGLKTLIRHIVKMTSQNLVVEEVIFDLINGIPQLVKYREDCQREITVLRDEKFNGSLITFYDILTADIHQLVKWSGNNEITNGLQNEDSYKERFGCYGAQVIAKLNKGIERRNLWDKVYKFRRVLFGRLPDLIVEMILEFLSNEDLATLIGIFYPLQN